MDGWMEGSSVGLGWGLGWLGDCVLSWRPNFRFRVVVVILLGIEVQRAVFLDLLVWDGGLVRYSRVALGCYSTYVRVGMI